MSGRKTYRFGGWCIKFTHYNHNHYKHWSFGKWHARLFWRELWWRYEGK